MKRIIARLLFRLLLLVVDDVVIHHEELKDSYVTYPGEYDERLKWEFECIARELDLL